jgi:hypothetical protein
MSTPGPASKPNSILYAACVPLADERCGNEHDSDKCCHARVRPDLIESYRSASFASALLRPLQHRGENVKFFELVALNGRKQRA